MNKLDNLEGVLIFPRLKVQNANTISSPLTWGFPSITAFMGLMWALKRKLPSHIGETINFEAIGVVCHNFQAQISRAGGYGLTFHLTRNPLDSKGATKSIAEEGRAHLEISIIIGVTGSAAQLSEIERQNIANEIQEILAAMRVAGGTILPKPKGRYAPKFIQIDGTWEGRQAQFKKIKYSLLPGSSLVLRQDTIEEAYQNSSSSNRLETWLDVARLKISTVQSESGEDSERDSKVEWKAERKAGWLVPIPIGFAALSELHEAGKAAEARDNKTPFRFVESVYGVGQWISPHRLNQFNQLLWYARTDTKGGTYLCINDYANLEAET